MKAIRWLILLGALGAIIGVTCLVEIDGSTLLQRWLASEPEAPGAKEQADPKSKPNNVATDEHTDSERKELDSLIRSRLDGPAPGKKSP